MRRYVLIIIFYISPLLVSATSQLNWDSLRHEVRVGWGKPIYESAMLISIMPYIL